MEENRRSKHLEELTHKHWYDIADGDPDVTHWNIIDDSGKKIGEVKDLLFDKEAEKVRYLITNLKDGMLEKESRILVPIGRARLNETDKRILLPAVTLSQLARVPEYTGPENLTAADERAIREVFSSAGSNAKDTRTWNKKNFYEHEDFQEGRYLGKS